MTKQSLGSIALITLVAVASAMAQEFRGTILGRITDPSAAPVLGASIEALNVDTGVAIKSTSNEQGNYQIPFLVPGNYMVRVEQAGFKRVEREGIRVATNTQVTLDFALELGATTETVNVTASAPLLNTASADLGQVVERNYLTSITVNLTRNVLNTVRLTPGVTGNRKQLRILQYLGRRLHRRQDRVSCGRHSEFDGTQ
jgi:hypothetical protein